MDVLAWGSNAQLLWCENEGGSEPTFVAHVLLGGASFTTLDVLASADAVLIVLAEQLVEPREAQLKWFRSVPGMSIVHASDDMLVQGPVVSGVLRLSIPPSMDDRVELDAFEFVACTSRAVTWYTGDVSSYSGFTGIDVVTGLIDDMDVSDVDGEDQSINYAA